MGREEFERDETIELGVMGFVDYTHAPLTEFFKNPVMRDCLADHSSAFDSTACPTLVNINRTLFQF